MASSCLDKDWSHPAVAWADANNEPEPFLQKANTFMASKARLDDQPRMMKVKEVGHKKFEIGSFSASERERLLGYPEGYVTRAGKKRVCKQTEDMTGKVPLTACNHQLTICMKSF
jgi:hypothetical protein